MIGYFYFKSVLAFQWAPVGMFRAQGQLLTPFQLRDTPRQRLNRSEFVAKTRNFIVLNCKDFMGKSLASNYAEVYLEG